MWLDQPRNGKAPLAGLKVLELARVLAGPWAGQILADLGADVIKVESPEGDGTRQWGPPWVERQGPDGRMRREAAYYHAANRGKRSVVADFGKPEDRARIRDLAPRRRCLDREFQDRRPCEVWARLHLAQREQPCASLLLHHRLWADRPA